MEHLVDKDVEIHIFNDPCYLSHEAENGQRQPKPPAQFGFLRRACVIHGITSFVGIIALIETDCNKNSPPRIRRGVSLYRLLNPKSDCLALDGSLWRSMQNGKCIEK